MVGPATALENFVFKALNPFGRATRSEFWIIMPLIWIGMLGLFYLDLRDFWGFLLRRERPPLNPFYYTSFFFIVLTFVPRLTLTARRLQDAGRRPIFAFLPYLSLVGFFWLGMAILTWMIINFISQAEVTSLLAIWGMATFLYQGGWESLYTLAAALQFMSFPELLLSAFENVSLPDTSPATNDLAAGFGDTGLAGKRMATQIVLLTIMPFLSFSLYLVFILMPSDGQENGYGKITETTRIRGPKSAEGKSAMMGYAALVQKRDTSDPAFQARKQEEVRALYQSRVLGKGQ